MNDAVIIVAAGSGSRMNSAVPKQFMELAGRPVLMHVIEKFHRYSEGLRLVVVLNREMFGLWNDLCRHHQFEIEHTTVEGGAERFYSVQKAVKSLEGSDFITAVHDGVRPLVSLRTIEHCFLAANEHCAAVPVVHIHDSIRELTDVGSRSLDRSQYRLVQTPQCFEISLLRKAYSQEFNPRFTDDASVVEALGERICLIEGNSENIKLTSPQDWRMAELLMTS